MILGVVLKGTGISVLIFIEIVFGANAWSAPKDCNGLLSWPSRIKTYWRDRNAYYEQVRDLFPKIQSALAAQKQSTNAFQSNFSVATRELGFASAEQSQLNREIGERFATTPDELLAHFQAAGQAKQNDAPLDGLSSEVEQQIELLILHAQSGVRVKHWLLELESMILRDVEARRQLVQDQIAYFKLVRDAKFAAAYEKKEARDGLSILENDLPKFESTEASQAARVHVAESERNEALARLRLLSGLSRAGEALLRRDILQPIYKARNQRIPTSELLQPPPPPPEVAAQNPKPVNLAQLEKIVAAARQAYDAIRPTAASDLLPKLQDAIVQRNFALRYFSTFEETFRSVQARNLPASEIRSLTTSEKASVEAWLMLQILEQRRARLEIEFDRQGSWARAEAQVKLFEAQLNLATAMGEGRKKLEDLRNALASERSALETIRKGVQDLEAELANLHRNLAVWQGHWPPWDQILRISDRQMLFANDGRKI